MRRFAGAGILLLLVAGIPAPLLAQLPDRGRVLIERGNSQALDPSDARQTRQSLRKLLEEHPPTVRIVLQADPSLSNRADYLAPYPRLSEFLKQHPEIARDPAFFFGPPGYMWETRERTPQDRAMEMLEGVLLGLALFTVAMTVLVVVAFLIRQIGDHRRWLRQSRVQTEVHTKILDRLQSNEDLLAYIQTPAGRRFLESGPSPQEAEPRAIGAPFGRILWSVQAGVMLVALGIGLWFVQRSVMEEIAPAFYAMDVIAVTLGIGAVVSAGVSYVLSARLGLVGTRG